MVFEGILVELLNRFLGPYVKNLDASQLKVGIWGGDVLLEKLELKENALDDLDLPIRIFRGYLGRLRLKIPWTNLYSERVVVEVDGVYVVAGPISAVQYDAAKDAKEQRERKEKQLKRTEEAKKKAEESKDKGAEKEKAPGFVEKLVTQIVRNVEVTVKNIHVRYEDAVTNPSSPFSCGVTLDSLCVQSTDSNYEVGATDLVSQLIYKLVQMNCLSAYWNSDATLFGTDPSDDWMEILKSDIARPDGASPNMQYVAQPITAEAKLQLSMQPDKNMDIPQALVLVVLQEVGVALGKQQFHDIMSLVESFDRMSRNRKFLKYKPLSPLREDRRSWWVYVITAVLEEDVKRRTRMWSWKHIKQHRELCKEYTQAYTKKLLSKSVPADLQTKLEDLEEKLDVFNLTICRQLAENRAIRERKEREEQQKAEGGGGWWGWATGWVGGGGSQDVAGAEEFKPPSEEELMKEKEKLYKAIGYSEDGAATVYPKEYVAHKLLFELNKVSVQLWNEDGTIASVETKDVSVKVEHRPSTKSISVAALLDSLSMVGQPRRDGEELTTPPEIITTMKDGTKGSLLKVQFDLNPIDSTADQKIRAELLPVQVIYDADTVDAIIGMFLLPKDVHLQKLSAAAASTLEELNTQTRAGLEHAINQRKLLDVDISLHSPYVIVPENGGMRESSTVLVADLGHLHITSDMKHHVPSVREASLKELEEAFYDHFNLQLTDVQVIVAGAGDDWMEAKMASSSSLHVLECTRFDLQLKKSLLPNDTRLPGVKVGGKLPNVTLNLSDKKIKQMLKVVQSLPLPPPSLASRPVQEYSYEKLDEPSVLKTSGILSTLSKQLVETAIADSDSEEESDDSDGFVTASEGEEECLPPPPPAGGKVGGSTAPSGGDSNEDEVAAATKLLLQFSMDKVGINFSEHLESSGEDRPRLNLEITSVEVEVLQRSWDLCVTASVNEITITDHYHDQGIPLLQTDSSEGGGRFLTVQYSKYDRESPLYSTTFQSTQQSISAVISLVKLKLQRESLANLISIMKSITSVIKTKDVSLEAVEEVTKKIEKAAVTQLEEKDTKPSLIRLPNERDLHLEARLGGVELTLCDHQGDVVCAHVIGLETNVDIYEERIDVGARMADIAVIDKEPSSCHSMVITKVDQSKDIISAKVVVYKDGVKDGDLEKANLGVEAAIWRLKVTVTFKFIHRVKEFTTALLDQLKLDQSTIESAKEAAAKTAEAIKEQSSNRLRLAVTIHAPVVIIPLSATSQSALVADLGQLEVQNCFKLARDMDKGNSGAEMFLSSSGLPAIVDCMDISISSIQLGRVVELPGEGVVPQCSDHVILKPLRFQGQVIRRLSDWCTAIPAIDVGATLQAVEVRFSPDDFRAVMSVMNSLNDGKTYSPPEDEIEKSVSPLSKESSFKEAEDQEQATGKEDRKKKDAKDGESSSNSFTIHVGAAIEAVQLLLHSSEGELATINVKGVSTNVDILGDVIRVKAGVSDMEVKDLSLHTGYPEIVSVAEGAKAIEAQVNVYTSATKGDGYLDMSKCDLSIDAQIGCIKMVVLFLFINKLVDFAKQFNISKKTIESAKKSAQEGATAAISAVQELHQNGQRLKLSVTLDAPLITIPISSNSDEIVVANLGHLKLSNTFHLVDGGAADQNWPIFEKHCIELTNLQVYRSICGHGADVSTTTACRRGILEPFNLDVVMKRNLSAAWYTGMPTIDVAANLGDLKMVASGDDIESVCEVLSGNLKEGSEKEEDEGSAEGQEEPSKAPPTIEQATAGKPRESVDYSEQPYVTLKVSAELRSIGIELYQTGKVLSHTDSSTWVRDPEHSLAQLTLHQFQASATIESHGAIDACVSMENCVLDNKRVEKKARRISRLVRKMEYDDDSDPQPMISLTYNMNEVKDMEVDVRVDGVQVLLDLPFILFLVSFLLQSLEPLTKQEELDPESDMDTPELEQLESKKSDSSTKKQSSESSSSGKIHVKASVTRPVIGLLGSAKRDDTAEEEEEEEEEDGGQEEGSGADVDKERQCQALVLKTQVDADLNMSYGEMRVSADIKDLHIAQATCEYSTQSLKIGNTKVLALSEPITASMKSSQGIKTEVKMVVPYISLVLSPATVRLILNVMVALKPDKSDEVDIGITSPVSLWDPQPLNRRKWYLKEDEVDDIEEEEEEEEEEGTSVDLPVQEIIKEESLSVVFEEVELKMEQELPSGHNSTVVTMTMGKYGSKALTLEVNGWSGQLSATAELSLEATYYNIHHDAWEPLLEPVVNPENENVYTSWILKAEVTKPEVENKDDLPPELAVRICSDNALQLTVTKTSIGIFNELWKEYLVKQIIEDVDARAPETYRAAFVIINKLGKKTPVTVKPKEGLKVHGAYSSVLQHNGRLPLHPTDGFPEMKPGELVPRDSHLRKVHIVQLEVPGFVPLEIALGTSEKLYYPLRRPKPTGKHGPKWALVAEVERQADGETPNIILRSPIQFANHLEEDVVVYWAENSSPEPPATTVAMEMIATVTKDCTIAVPLEYSRRSGFFYVKPRREDARPSQQYISRKSETKAFDVACRTATSNIFIHVQIEEEQYSRQPAFTLETRSHHIFHLCYPVVAHNLLPVPIHVGESWENMTEIASGGNIHFQYSNLSQGCTYRARLELDGRIWKGSVRVGPKSTEYKSLELSPSDNGTDTVVLTVIKEEKGTWHLSIFCPYWMVNKTQMTLQYSAKGSKEFVSHPPPSKKNPLNITLFPHKEVQVRLLKDGSVSNWSKPFSLDAVGSEGIFCCSHKSTDESREYQMGTKVQLSNFGFTKIITISPFYMVYNKTRDSISFLEDGLKQRNIITVGSKQLVPFWPQTSSEKMSVTVDDPTMVNSSLPLRFTETGSLLIRTMSEIPAVEVDIQVTGSANIITFNPYYNGSVPLQLVNDTDFTIEFKQDSSDQSAHLSLLPDQSLMYTWDNPLGSQEIVWSIPQQQQIYKIGLKDDSGDFPLPKRDPSVTGEGEAPAIEEVDVREGEDKPQGTDQSDTSFRKVTNVFKSAGRGIRWFTGKKKPHKHRKKGDKGYWVSFMDGLQRVMLFTTSSELHERVLQGNKTERPYLELTLSLLAVGISLVDDDRGLEVAYIGMPQSDVIWEERRRGRRWKPLSRGLKNKLEDLYQEGHSGKVVDVPNMQCKVDFTGNRIFLLDKTGSKKRVRRSHYEGVYAMVSLSTHLTSIQARVNEVQIDNQLPFALNPTILYTYPTPPTVASKFAPKPFVEASLIIRNTEQSTVNEIQFFQVLIQEMGVSVDMSFILAVTRILLEATPSRSTEAALIEQDIKYTELSLEKSKVSQVSAAATKNYFKYLHLSPLHIHLSFSLEKSNYDAEIKNASERNVVLGTILNFMTTFASLIGKTKNAELKLGYFDLENKALTQRSLMDRITKHYIQEGAVQIYSVVLGLEVLGNPVGFIKGLTGGTIGLFYQPIQGAVLGPEEFFEGLSLGGRQFVGGTIGGLSGMVGQVTGVLGDTVAKLTFDDDFQGKRQQQKAGSVGQGLEGAAKGILEGVTGVITQPVKGAKKEGLWGLMKGTGKGMIGLVLRPTGGLIDLTSATFTAVQKKTQVGDVEVAQNRAARYIGHDKIVYPYSPHKAAGYGIFLSLDNGELLKTETYFDHLELTDKPVVLLITSRRLVVVKRNWLLDKWEADWRVDFSDVSGLSTAKESSITIPVIEQQGLLSGFGFMNPKKKGESTRGLHLKTPLLAQESVLLINQAYEEYRTTQTLDSW